jgi:uncharacterized repeat protein (TIGR01451 family)
MVIALRRGVLVLLMSGLWGTRSPAAGPDLRLTGTDTPDPVTVGELLNYNLVVTNVGTGAALGVMLTNTLSSNATFFSASLSQGTNTAGEGLVVCNLGSINAGSAATIQITITPGAAGTITNSAIVSLAQADANPADNFVMQTTLVVPTIFYEGPNLTIGRSHHTATTLFNGKILVAGGNGSSGVLASAELYDPATKTFTPTGNMTTNRTDHAATLLPDGTVLITGGLGTSYGLLHSAEIYHPTNGTFTAVNNMLSGHAQHTSTLLQDGRVLIAGTSFNNGSADSDPAVAEIYDPSTHGFTLTGRLNNGAGGHRAILLANGKVVLLTGGASDLYDPVGGTFSWLGYPQYPRTYAGVAQLLDGRILLAGGSPYISPPYSTSSEIFDPAALAYATNASMLSAHSYATATRLLDGRVLVTGNDTTPDLFDPVAGTFSHTVQLTQSRMMHTATLLPDGSVLIIGGLAGTNLTSTEIYDPARTALPPAVSIANAAGAEGDTGTTNLIFNLTLSSPMGLPVSVDFATSDNSAVGGVDYVGTNGTVIFPSGSTNLSITVAVIGNRDYEPDKTFQVNLSNPTNTSFGIAQGTGTILNDDPIPTVTVAPATVLEPNVGTTNVSLTAYLSAKSYQAITVNYATSDGSALAGSDYIATNGLLTFNPGTTNLTLGVLVKGDTLYETNEAFYMVLSSPTNVFAGAPGVVTIISDDGLPGVLDHFTFSAITPPQYATFPIGLTITARDVSNVVVTTFNGSVMLSGSTSNTPGYWFDFEEGDFSQWTPLNLGNSPGPYQIVPFDVPGHGHPSLAFRIAANSGAADGITRPVSLQGGATYAFSVDIASMNENGTYANGDPGTAHLLINSQEVATMNFGVFGTINPGQIFRTNLFATYLAPSNGSYQLSVRFDRGYLESDVWNYADNVRVMTPPLTPTWISPFTNGIWSGSFIAKAAASNLVLHVDDGDGHFGDSAPFTILNYTDVALQTSVSPNPARVGSNAIYTLVLTNTGPGAATGLVLTNLLPPNQTFVSATSTAGPCTFSNGTVRCAVGTLFANQSATVTIMAQPLLPGTATNLAGFISVNFDPNLTNNTAVLVFSIKPPLLYVQGPTVVERSHATTNAVFNVFVGGPFTQTIDVDYATADGTATAGLDYLATSGHLTFTPAITNRSVTVIVSNDLVHESTETFALNLSNPVNAELANGGTANGTILNTDPAAGLNHFDFSAIPSPQQGSVAFPVTITARDTNDLLLTAYSSTLTLTSTNVLGNPVPLSPSSVSMVNGQWTGSVTVSTWAFQGVRITATDSDGDIGLSGSFDVSPPTVSVITLSASDLAYSETSKLIYASVTNSSVLTPIDPFSATVGASVSITNLSGRLCASDGGQYIFAALNGVTNHICQFDVNSQSVVNAWTLDGTYVEDMTPVLGSPSAVAVSRRIPNRSPRFGGVVIYDNGTARTNVNGGFTGSNVIEPSRSPSRLYGYDNEVTSFEFQLMKVDASGVTVEKNLGLMSGFGVDFACRGGWIFATTGQIFDPERGVQVGSFGNTPVADDAASARYYLVSAGALVAYDQNTLLPVGVTPLPGVTGAAGSFIRWGTNGFALRMNTTKVALIRTPLVSTGPSADLRLSVNLPALPVAASNTLSYTLTVSNQGPATAQNAVLTQTLPANVSFLSATTSSGSNVLTSGGLVVSLLGIPAGGSVAVTVNLQTLKPGLLTAVASVTSDSLDPILTNNLVNLEVPVATVPARDTVAELALPTTDLVWDRFSGRIFASIPNANWLQGNSIAALNPLTGNFDPRIAMATEPAKLAVADNGQYLYAGINSDNSIQRVNLAARAADLKFPTGLNYVADMAVLPGSPHAVVVTAHTTFAVYDDGVMRPNTVAPGSYNFQYYLAVSDTNTLAYEAMPDGLRSISIDAAGATVLNGLGLIRSFDDQIHFDAGRLYTAGGEVIDPSAAVVLTNLPYSGLVCPDSPSGKVFYLTVSGSIGTLHAVNVSNFIETGNVTIPNISGTPTSLIRWGVDGLAFRTTGGQLFLVRTTLADDRNNDGLPDSWQIQYFGYPGAPGSGPLDDPDHDGMNNLQEFLTGSNPLAYDSLRFLTWQMQTNGTYRMTVLGIPGQRYALLASTNLTDWVPILTFTSTNTSTVVLDPAAGNYARRFYRIGPLANVPPPWLGFGSTRPLSSNGLDLTLEGFAGVSYRIDVSTNLKDWAPLATLISTNSITPFRDSSATNLTWKFYRAVVP